MAALQAFHRRTQARGLQRVNGSRANPQPASLRQRYDAGERRAVWDELHALAGFETLEPVRREDVLAVVDATVARADRNVRTIHARLVSLGYVFDFPGDNAFGEVDSALKETLDLFAELGPLPPVVARLFARFGTVSFRGWLPSVGSEDAWKEQLIDPLDLLPDYDVDGSDVIPFIAAGCRSKNDSFKELTRTRLLVPAPGIDALVHEANAVEPIWFVDYLRLYFAAGGFRTVDETRHTPAEFVRLLASDLLEI